MKMFRRDEGFTLVELMVVVLIIGILVAIAVPIFNAAKASAQQKTCFANQRTLEGADQSYQASTGNLVPAGDVDGANVLISGGYIKSPPYCPAVGVAAIYHLDGTGTVSNTNGCTHGHY